MSARPIDHAKTLRSLQRMAKLMDTAWGIPFTRWRFGLDSLVGLIPGGGDLVMLLFSAYSLLLAQRLGAPGSLLLRMAGNLAIDFGIGSIPVIGDVFDVFFKSNTRNLKLITEFLEQKTKTIV
jgi:Domain of unknown function (DUF4112)